MELPAFSKCHSGESLESGKILRNAKTGARKSQALLWSTGVYRRISAFTLGLENSLIIVAGSHFPEWIHVTHPKIPDTPRPRLPMGVFTRLTKY